MGMKFRKTAAYRYWWPVTVSLPDPDNPGKILTQTFKAEFEAQTREAGIAASDAYAALKTEAERAAFEHQELHRIVRNWDEVTEDDGKTPLPFSEAAFEECLQFSWFRQGVRLAYAESQAGQEARLGN